MQRLKNIQKKLLTFVPKSVNLDLPKTKGEIMAESKSELRYVKIGLTPDEYEVIAKLAELDGKPVATFYVNFMREAGTFTVLKQVLKASEKVLEIKGKFKADTQEKMGVVSASIT